MDRNQKVSICIVGAGSRGRSYSNYSTDFPDEVHVVGVAEPRDFYRNDLVEKYAIPPENVFNSWQELAAHDGRVADAVIIATPDQKHTAAALALIDKGYHVLLEKPMAPTREECERIVAAARAKKILFGVCHVMRYTQYTQKLKQLLDDGLIGEIVSIQHLEPVGFSHQAHSYVRGQWSNEKESSCMLLAKSCHDMDWLRYIVGSKIAKVSSFGHLRHFTAANKPQGASERCVDCPVEPDCPYSAIKIYLDLVKKGHTGWPVDIITPDTTVAGVQAAIKTGPYGRCVYACNNDVVDHQVVGMEFENGASGAFTMTAFCEGSGRKTRIFGTKGELYGDGKIIDHYDFLGKKHALIDASKVGGSIVSGHGGGDYGLMKKFIEAVATNDQSAILSGPVESLETHTSVFAAEEARKTGRVVAL
ncbi:Gfo/Idh/MocA family protein [Pontiella sp.]|uniref:Gfo/Idh/MocA family protein n=1 Tax=Pontiella sp. TaxID=2837462 RepID=UPI00356B3E02